MSERTKEVRRAIAAAVAGSCRRVASQRPEQRLKKKHRLRRSAGRLAHASVPTHQISCILANNSSLHSLFTPVIVQWQMDGLQQNQRC